MYYECHITIEPVFGERLEQFAMLCAGRQFKPAKLLMQKRAQDTPERSARDSFCTGHAQELDAIQSRMIGLTDDLVTAGFQVWRRKIEHVVYDERMKP
jgi:hypothetical protein